MLSIRRSALTMRASELGSTRRELPQFQQRSSQGRRPSLTMPVCPQRQVTLISMGGSKSRTASARQAGRLGPLDAVHRSLVGLSAVIGGRLTTVRWLVPARIPLGSRAGALSPYTRLLGRWPR